ncbi:MAG: hypothetical protein QF535_23605, partial [Anaerolineales bacterium]|nr:hypothetical protein [Anaerolineales bacterium]
NTVGAPLDPQSVSGTNYKTDGGALSSFNTIPTVAIASHNDGVVIYDDTPTLQWTYTDKDNNSQHYYQIQVSNDNFVSTVVDTGVVTSSDISYTTANLPITESGLTYRWRVRVSDGFDYSGWQEATNGFRVNTVTMEMPIIWARVSATGNEIAEELWQNDGDPYLYWDYPVTGAEVAGYSYAWGSVPDDEIDTIGVSYQTPQGLLNDGVREFFLRAQNTAGTWSDTASFQIWVDREEPVVGSYSPVNSELIATDVPTISVAVSDIHSGVNPDGIELRINKAKVSATYDDGAQDVIAIPKIALGEGDNVVSLEVNDLVGNKSDLLVWSFVIDTVKPTGVIVIHNEDALTNSIYVNLDLSATDSTSGLNLMAISNDGVFDSEPWESFSMRKENWALDAISGTRKVFVKFQDKAGNISEIFNDTIELVIVAPDTIITSGPSLQTKSTDALFTFKSTTSGSVFRWKFDAEEWSEWSTEDTASKTGLSK